MYLIRVNGKKQSAHIWNGKDTACKMWSTGGMNKEKEYEVHQTNKGKHVCTMCLVNSIKD